MAAVINGYLANEATMLLVTAVMKATGIKNGYPIIKLNRNKLRMPRKILSFLLLDLLNIEKTLP